MAVFLGISLLGRHFFVQPLPIFSDKAIPLKIEMQKPGCNFRVIGHRGDSYTAPEDTILSIDQAFNVGANMVEVDVRLNKESVPVLMHDALLDRTTNGSGPVSEWSTEMLKTLDAGSWKGSQFKHVKVPTLAEAIQAAAGRGPLYLDIKVANLHVPIAKMLEDYHFPPDSVYPSVTSLQMLKAYHEVMPQTPIIWFRNIPKNWNESWFDVLVAHGVVGLELYWSTVQALNKEQSFIKMAKDKGLEIWTYTLNGKKELLQAVNLNVDGIETDRPNILKRIACSGEVVDDEPLKRLVGLWDFGSGNLNGSIGSNLRHWGSAPDDTQKLRIALASEFELPFPKGKDKKILYVPAFNAKQAIQMEPGLHHFGPGNGHRINQYSLVFDLLWQKKNIGKKQALLQSNWRNANEAEIYIMEDGSLGNEQISVGKIKVDVWQRIVVAVDLLHGDRGQVRVFLDGVLQGILPGDGVDGHYSVQSNISNRPLLLFSDKFGNSESLFVSEIQLYDYVVDGASLGEVGNRALLNN